MLMHQGGEFMVLWEFSQWFFPGRISYTGRRAPWSARCFHRSVLGDVVPPRQGPPLVHLYALKAWCPTVSTQVPRVRLPHQAEPLLEAGLHSVRGEQRAHIQSLTSQFPPADRSSASHFPSLASFSSPRKRPSRSLTSHGVGVGWPEQAKSFLARA